MCMGDLDWILGRTLTATGSRSYHTSAGLRSVASMRAVTLSGAISPNAGSDPTGCPSARGDGKWRASEMMNLKLQRQDEPRRVGR